MHGAWFIDYFYLGFDGSLIDQTIAKSQRYRADLTSPYSGDVFGPGAPVGGWSVQATGIGGTRSAANNGVTAQVIATGGPTVQDRSIIWCGQWTDAAAGINIAFTEKFTLGLNDRAITFSLELVNLAATPVSDVYLMLSGDTDQGQQISGTFDTLNDIYKQRPADATSFATAQYQGSDGNPPYTFAFGSDNVNSRASNTGFNPIVPGPIWENPTNENGGLIDGAIQIVFKEATLAAGGVVRFNGKMAWGISQADALVNYNA